MAAHALTGLKLLRIPENVELDSPEGRALLEHNARVMREMQRAHSHVSESATSKIPRTRPYDPQDEVARWQSMT